MGKLNIKKDVDKIFIFLMALLILVGSVGVLKNICIPLALTFGLSYLGLKIILNQKIIIPPNLNLYIIFLITLIVHSFIFEGKVVYFWLFLGGGFFGVLAYNNLQFIKKYLYTFLVFWGLLMAAISVYLKSTGLNFLSPDNLFLPLEDRVIHNHLGDLWAMIFIYSIFILTRKINIKVIAITLLSVFIIAGSSSRSALITVTAGMLLFSSKLSKKLPVKIYKIAIVVGFLLSTVLLLYFSRQKSILAARPYYFESIVATLNSPLGIGIGNFSNVSNQTNIVHNLILEILMGLGVFSLPFFVWLYKAVTKSLVGDNNILYTALLLGLLTNFIFDSTYVIPGLLWFFYVLIALV